MLKLFSPVSISAALLLLLGAGAVHKVSAASHNAEVETATEVRLLDPGWWPTKGAAKRDQYVGSAKCAECHAEITKTQLTTPMAQALTPGASAVGEKTFQNPLQFHIGSYTYSLAHSGNRLWYSVSDGKDSASLPISWIFGSGESGRTFVYQENGKFYESRLSYYTAPQALDFTVGHPRSAPLRIDAALGRRMPADEIPLCFGCHSTASTSENQFSSETLIAGVTCEACHGPGSQHVAVMSEGDTQAAALIMNPARLGPVDSVDFCGACHRTPVDVALTGATGVQTLRFPAYRLQRSRCWGKGDARLTCMACHNPHEPLVREPEKYDRNCLGCHTASVAAVSHSRGPRTCPVSQKNCVTCHMPKRNVPELHGAFTDHKIAVYRPGAPFQD